jgi:hypothetical protein
MKNDYGLYELIQQALEEQSFFNYWTEIELGVFSLPQHPENVNHSFLVLEDILSDYGIRPTQSGFFISRERNSDSRTSNVYDEAIIIEVE